MFIVIAGCGRLGANLATELSEEDHDVVVVDRDPASFKRLGRSFGGLTLVGTAIDEQILDEAQIERADVFAAVTDHDTTNIMAAQVAKQVFRVPKVIARITDPRREVAYQGFGFVTICPTRSGVYNTKAAILSNGCRRLFDLGNGIELFQLGIDRDWVGKSVEMLSGQLGAINAIIRNGETLLVQPGAIVAAGDQLVVTTSREQLLRLKRLKKG